MHNKISSMQPFVLGEEVPKVREHKQVNQITRI